MAVPKDPRQLETAEPFVSLYPVVPSDLALVTRSMRERGYVKDRPILAWRDAFGEKDRLVIVYGHTRRLAALDAGLGEVTVTLRRFDSVDEALLEAIEEQLLRRNFTRSQQIMHILPALARLDNGRHGQGSRNDLVGRSAQQLADMFGVGRATIERARALLLYGDPELIDRVRAGDLGLKEAADIARKAGQEEEQKVAAARASGNAADEEAEAEPDSAPNLKLNVVVALESALDDLYGTASLSDADHGHILRLLDAIRVEADAKHAD